MSQPPRDLRRYGRSTMIRLIAGGLILAILVGNVLIYALYGREAMGLSLLCMGAFLAPGLLIVILLAVMGRIVERDRER